MKDVQIIVYWHLMMVCPSLDLEFLVFIRILDDLLSMCSVLWLGLTWLHPQLMGHPIEDPLVVNNCESSSRLLVSRVIQTNCSIGSGLQILVLSIYVPK